MFDESRDVGVVCSVTVMNKRVTIAMTSGIRWVLFFVVMAFRLVF